MPEKCLQYDKKFRLMRSAILEKAPAHHQTQPTKDQIKGKRNENTINRNYGNADGCQRLSHPAGGGDTSGLLSSGAGNLEEDGFEFRWSIERFQYSTCCPRNSDLTVDYDSPLNRGQVYILNVNRVDGNIDGSIDGRIVVSSSSPGVANDSTGPSYIGTITPGDPGEGYLDGDIAEILNLQRRWPSRCCG
jgi:hypothetical protein